MHTYQFLSEILQALDFRTDNQADADLLRLIVALAEDPKAASLVTEFAREALPILGWIQHPTALTALADRLGIDWPTFDRCLQRLGRIHRLLASVRNAP